MIPPSTTITDEGRRTRRTLYRLAALVVGLNIVVWAASSLSSGGGVAGPDGSSFVTTRAGAAAAAGTLERLGVTVEQSRLPLDEVELAPTSSLVLIDVGGADYTSAELNALESFLQAGGTVLVAGRASFVDRLLPEPSRWVSGGTSEARPAEPALDPSAFGTVPMSGFGSFDVSPADTVLMLGPDGTPAAVSRQVGDGRVVWVADSHPFHNEAIGVGDSAVMMVVLLDPQGTVVFDEYRHGFREDAGLLDVLPSNWRTALLLTGITALLGLIAYARRFGPPYDVQRRLPPGRDAYLEAVAGILARSDSVDDAVHVIRDEARDRLAQLVPGGQDLAHAARIAGLDEAATRAVLGDAADRDTLLAADRALATLNREVR